MKIAVSNNNIVVVPGFLSALSYNLNMTKISKMKQHYVQQDAHVQPSPSTLIGWCEITWFLFPRAYWLAIDRLTSLLDADKPINDPLDTVLDADWLT